MGEGGHDVPREKIESRYYKSLEWLFEAAQLFQEVYFFDNSITSEGGIQNLKLIGMSKQIETEMGTKRELYNLLEGALPAWFERYYLNKWNQWNSTNKKS